MGLWDDESANEEFRDIPEETSKSYVPEPQMPAHQQRPAPAPQTNQAQFNGATGRFEAPVSGPTDEEFLDSVLNSVEAEDDYSEVLNDANLRIEQGRLYQMIMNHELFDGMDADPKAVQNVQREIRKFARESMEVMLGMRDTTPVRATLASPFNDLEVDILKKLASKATNGATESPEANQVAAAVREVPKRATLKPLGGSTNLKKPAPVQQNFQPQKKLANTPTAPVKRTKNDAIIDQILSEEGVSRQELELEYVGIGKQLHQLTSEELEQRQKATAARMAKRKTVKSTSAIPMASPEQEVFLATQRAQAMAQSPGMAALLAKVSSMPVKNP